jgi:hypothetical protein
MLTAERLREMLRYKPETGEWFWRKAPVRTTIKVGDKAGTRDPNGRLIMCLDCRLHKGHRLAFLYMLGRWPVRDVDHRDGNPLNDAWPNLREATDSQNAMNKKRQANSSGLKGVCWNKKAGRWQASIMIDNKAIYLGLFSTAEAAHAVYCEQATKLFGEFARFL